MANLGSLIYQMGVDTAGLKKAELETRNSAGKMKESISGVALAVGSIFAGFTIGAGVKSLVDTATQMDSLNTKLKFSVGGAREAQDAWSFLRSESNRLGLDLGVAADAFSKFASAARGTSMAGEPVRKIFKGVSEAVAVMGLSNEEASGAMLALTQMMSKGKVQAEELRGQLGERIPGAFQIAARAMNMTTAELDKFMADGKLVAEEFLPRFGAQLSKEMVSGLTDAQNSMRANIARMSTAWLDLKTKVLSGGFADIALTAVKELTTYISKLGNELSANKASVQEFFTGLKETGLALRDLIVPALSGTISGFTKLASVFNSMPSELKTGLGAGLLTRYLLNSTPAGAAIGTVVILNQSMESLNRSMDAQLPTIQRTVSSWEKLDQAVKNIVDSISGTKDWRTGEEVDRISNTMGRFRKLEAQSVREAAKDAADAWKTELSSLIDSLDQLETRKKAYESDPLGRKGSVKEDSERKIKFLGEQQAQTQKHINSLLEERNAAESEYAARMADSALKETKQRAERLAQQQQEAQAQHLQSMVLETMDRVRSGKISEKEVQENITDIMKDQQSTALRINDLTFERERLERMLKASSNLDESREIAEAIAEIDKQLMPARDHASALQRALDDMSQARRVVIDADTDKFKLKVDELIAKRDELTREIKLNLNTKEVNDKLDEVTTKLRNIMGNNFFLSSEPFERRVAAGQGIYAEGEKISKTEKPQGVIDLSSFPDDMRKAYGQAEEVLSKPIDSSFVINTFLAKSPAVPFSEGYASLISDLQSLPNPNLVIQLEGWNESFSMVSEEIQRLRDNPIFVSMDIADPLIGAQRIVEAIDVIPKGFDFQVDVTSAISNLNRVASLANQIGSMLGAINGMRSEFTVEGYWQSSPRVPFSQGYSELLKKLLSIPVESQYTIKYDSIAPYSSVVGKEHFGAQNYNVLPQIPGADPGIYQTLLNTISTMKEYLNQPSPFAYGNSTNPMFGYYLDKIPALEAAARISTGKAQDIRLGDLVINFAGADREGNIDIEALMVEIEKKLKANLKSRRSRTGGLQAWG